MTTLFSHSELSYTLPSSSSSSSTSSSAAFTRADGRSPHSHRPISIQISPLSSTLGSSRVEVGESVVQVGIGGEVGDGPGSIGVGIELSAVLPSTTTNAAYLHSLPSQLSNLLSYQPLLEQLTVVPPTESSKGKAWTLTVTMTVLSHSDGGSLVDLGLMGIGIALRSMRIPALRTIFPSHPSSQGMVTEEEEGKGHRGKEGELSGFLKGSKKSGGEWELDGSGEQEIVLKGLEGLPLSISLYLVGGKEVLDPTPLEEQASSNVVSFAFSPSLSTSTGITTTEEEEEEEVLGVSIRGEGEISTTEISRLARVAEMAVRNLRKIIAVRLKEEEEEQEGEDGYR